MDLNKISNFCTAVHLLMRVMSSLLIPLPHRLVNPPTLYNQWLFNRVNEQYTLQYKQLQPITDWHTDRLTQTQTQTSTQIYRCRGTDSMAHEATTAMNTLIPIRRYPLSSYTTPELKVLGLKAPFRVVFSIVSLHPSKTKTLSSQSEFLLSAP